MPGAATPTPIKKKRERGKERGQEERKNEESEKRNQKRMEVEPVIPIICGHRPLILAAPRPLTVMVSEFRASRQQNPPLCPWNDTE